MKDNVWDDCADIIETCRMSLDDLRCRLETLSNVRAAGTCQCSDDEACKFVRQREELRTLLKEAMSTLDAKWPARLFERVKAAVEDDAVLDDGWVKAKDRLPDCGDAVLALAWGEGMQVLSLSPTHPRHSSVARLSELESAMLQQELRWVGMGHMSWRINEVSHWIPLPKPPKE